MRVKLLSGATWMLHNVMQVPGLKRNLISVSQLTKEGYQVAIGSERFRGHRGYELTCNCANETF